MRLLPALLLAGLACIPSALAQDEPPPQSPLPEMPEAPSPVEAPEVVAPSWVVDTVRIEGARSVEPASLRASIRFATGDSLSEEALADRQGETLRQILATGLFDDAAVDFEEPVPGHVVVILRLREFPAAGVVSWSGNHKLDDKDLKELARITPGTLLSPAALERDRQAFLRAYREKGYLDAKVEAKRMAADPDGQIPVAWTIVEGEKVRVGKIIVHGNASIKTVRIRKAMRTKERRWWRTGEFHEDSLQLDLQTVRELYQERGFLDAKVDSQRVVPRPGGTRLDIHLYVSEGLRYRRGRVTFMGNELFSDKQLRAQLLIDSSEIMNQKKLEGEEQNLRNAYLEEGRIFMQIKAVRTYRDSLVDILYTLQEGPSATVGDVSITGNTKTRDKVIRRELKTFPGDLYRQSLLMRSFREIMQLNFFDNVVPDLKPRDDGRVDVAFQVTEKERGTGTLQAGAAYSQSDGFVGTFGTTIPNMLGTGRSSSLNIEIGEYKQSYSISASEPWFRDTPTRLGGSVFYTHTVNQYYDDRDITKYGFGLSLGRRLSWPDDYFSASAGYNFSFNTYGSLGDREGLLQTDGLESSGSLTLTRDDRDLPMFPTSGSYYQFYLRQVGGFMGGDFDYLEGRAKVKWFFPMTGKLVLGMTTEGGALDGPTIQASDLYVMGGTLGYSGSLRGYNSGSVGAGRLGRAFVSGTAELRYPIADQVFYLLAFADAGNVFGKALRDDVDDNVEPVGSVWEDLDLGTLKRDVGFGFRLNIPMMGVLGFDFAWGLDPNEDSDGEPISNNGFHANFIIETGY